MINMALTLCLFLNCSFNMGLTAALPQAVGHAYLLIETKIKHIRNCFLKFLTETSISRRSKEHGNVMLSIAAAGITAVDQKRKEKTEARRTA